MNDGEACDVGTGSSFNSFPFLHGYHSLVDSYELVPHSFLIQVLSLILALKTAQLLDIYSNTEKLFLVLARVLGNVNLVKRG